MDDIQTLHTAARRYCMDQAHFWHRRYAEMHADPNSERALATYPRYNVLEAILEEVERFVPEDFRTLAEARERLATVGQTAENLFTKPPNAEISVAAMQEEREKFVQYVCDISADMLHTVEPLPYRRTLTEDECRVIWDRLKEKWGADTWSDWYPMNGMDTPLDTLAFHTIYFDREVGDQTVREILIAHEITRIWELREYGPAYEVDTAVTEFCYNGAEGYWTSGDMDWLIYASHESSITLAGDWLIAELKRAWPNWQQCIYTGWDQA